jgi:hypothetical protein
MGNYKLIFHTNGKTILDGEDVTKAHSQGYTLIDEFTTPTIQTGNGEQNRWEGYITQGLPYPDFENDRGEVGWRNKLTHDPHKIYLKLYWVDEENSITQEEQVFELTGLGKGQTIWPLAINEEE